MPIITNGQNKMITHTDPLVNAVAQTYAELEEAKLPVPMKNTDYGFLGSLTKGNAVDAKSMEVIKRAVALIRKAKPGVGDKEVAEYLDSRLGRHLADVMDDPRNSDEIVTKYVAKDFKRLAAFKHRQDKYGAIQ